MSKFYPRAALLVSLNLALGSVAQPAHAADSGKYMVYGPGTSSCGQWVAARRSRQWYEQGVWVLGFVSGYGYSGPAMAHTDAEAIASWIDNYCQKNPLESIAEAAGRLVEELQARK
jgi:hypothetical protein